MQKTEDDSLAKLCTTTFSSATESSKNFCQLITKVLPSDKCFHKDKGAKLTFASKHAGHFGPCTFQAPQCTMQVLIPIATHTTPSNAALHESKLKIIPLHLLQAASVYLLSGEKNTLCP